MIINLTYDPSVANAPAGFTAALTSVVNFFQNNFSNPVTVNIAVGWGEVQGQALSAGALGENASFLQSTTYSALTSALMAHGTSSADASAYASLPASDPTGGVYWLTTAEAKALGMTTAGGLDGFMGFSSQPGIFDFQESDAIAFSRYDFFAVAVHEITEIMGRQLLVGATIGSLPNGYEPLDLFHFTAAGVRGFTGSAPGYFSADNGTTNLDSFNTSPGGDFGDWAATAGHDAFLAFSNSSVVNAITPADMTLMDVLGWTVIPRPDLAASSLAVGVTSVSYTVGNTGSAVAAASTAAVYLSTDASITTADILIGSGATPSLGLLASDPESVVFNLPTNLAVGTYFIGVIADGPDQLTEFDENNNVSNVVPVILGNNGANTLTGTSGANLLIAMGGDDSLNGGAGADTMVGGTGDDTYSVDNAGDKIVENPGEGVDLALSSVTHTLEANVENLTLTGATAINGTGNGDGNVITGNTGANVLAGLGGADTINGGGGIDTASYAASGSGVSVSLAAGTASGGDAQGDVLNNISNLTGSAFDDVLEGDGGNNVLVGGAGLDTVSYAHAAAGVTLSLALAAAQDTGGAGIDTVSQFENLTGSAFADTLTGSSAANVITGLDGNDSLVGGAGADTLVGGTGDDTYSVDNAGDKIVENPGEGVDLALSSVTHTLEANVENLTLTGATAINGTGNGDGNVITGNTGNNILAGLGGADTINGGGGVDTASYAASGSGVTVSLAAGTATGGDATGDVLSSISNLTGSAFDDVLEGDGGNNVLVGGGGNDTVSYAHATAGVSVSLALTTAQNTGGAGVDTVTQFENLTGSAFADTLTGSSAANVITGLDGNDSLVGGSGTDTLVGGGGDDSLTGGASGDHFVFADVVGGVGVDTIMDFSHVQLDKIDLSGIDANTTLGGDQAFTFIGASAFHGVAGELRFVVAGGNTTVLGDTNGDGVADFTLNLNAVTTLVSGDFIF